VQLGGAPQWPVNVSKILVGSSFVKPPAAHATLNNKFGQAMDRRQKTTKPKRAQNRREMKRETRNDPDPEIPAVGSLAVGTGHLIQELHDGAGGSAGHPILEQVWKRIVARQHAHVPDVYMGPVRAGHQFVEDGCRQAGGGQSSAIVAQVVGPLVGDLAPVVLP